MTTNAPLNPNAAPAVPMPPDLGDFQKIADQQPIINPGAPPTTPGAIDPNTGGLQAPPAKPQMPRIGEQEEYVDEWAKDPSGMPPVRTWVDPTMRDPDGDGEYLSAWHDTPATPLTDAVAETPVATPEPTPAPVAAPRKYRVSYQGPTQSDDGTTTIMDDTGKVVHTVNGLVGQNAFNNRSEIDESELSKVGYAPPAPPTPTPAPAPAV